MPDFESPLKVIWEKVDCPVDTCGAFCGKFAGKYCKGHAALLEMVDGYHLPHCLCGKPWFKRCEEERRRLRAAVGVQEKS